jgi:hypothetical protein
VDWDLRLGLVFNVYFDARGGWVAVEKFLDFILLTLVAFSGVGGFNN